MEGRIRKEIPQQEDVSYLNAGKVWDGTGVA